MNGQTSKLLMGIAYLLERIIPMQLRLKQAHIKEEPIIYLSKTLLHCILAFTFISASIISMFHTLGEDKLMLGLGLGAIVSVFIFYSRLQGPVVVVKKRVADIEKNLVFAVQSLYIQISSGTPVYDAMLGVSQGRYGAISTEFGIAISDMTSGMPLVEALEDVAMRNPSPYFQKIIWQMVNTINTGGNLADNLNSIVETLSREQVNMVKSYGAKLSPLSMAYMLVAVIVPSLGTTVLITISSLPNIGGQLTPSLFWGILAFTLIMQVQFAMIIKLRRPNLIGE